MRHNRDEKRFDRTYSHLRAMLSNMTCDLMLVGRIKTTTPRAKVLRRFAERMITLGKSGTLSARRRAFAFMRSKAAVDKLFSAIAPKYTERNGGYTRIMKIGERPGDNASMSIIELVEGKETSAAAAPEAGAAKPRASKKPAKKTAAKPAKTEGKAEGPSKGRDTGKEARPKDTGKAKKEE